MKLRRIKQKMLLNKKLGISRKYLFYSICLCTLITFTSLCLPYISEDYFPVINVNSLKNRDFKANEASLIVLVVSRRDAFDRRETIRRTWASGHEHVYFVVSELYCPYPPENRVFGTCNWNNQPTVKEHIQYNLDKEKKITERLRNESNVVLLPITDVFEELPNLIKESYHWALRNHNSKWLLHVDDSFNVQVHTFKNYVISNFDTNENIIMMLLIQCISSLKHTSNPTYLTPFKCALNHVVSREVAEYLVDGLDAIFEYKYIENSSSIQVLDTPLIKSVHREEFGMMTLNGGCSNTAAIVLDLCIGYNMNTCLDGTTYSLSENPSDYLHSDRFDLIPKMVYAYFYVFKKQVPYAIRDAYLEHIRVWNNFREYCSMKEIWFDSKVACKEKNGSSDFISSFHKTIQNVKEFGFNPNISRIPVDKNGFINNGAHRLASSVVLSKQATFEHHKYKENSGWGYKHFKRLGLSENSFDLVLLEWIKIQLKLPDLNTLIDIVSVFSNDNSKDEKMRTIVKERCSKDNGIVYEKSVTITRKGAQQLISHMYGQQSWLETKIEHMLSRFTHSTFTVLFLFVYTKRSTDLVKCKHEIRKLYNDKIFKSTAHIPDSKEENLILAEMILNPNSIQFLNYADNAPDCELIAKEIASRLSTAPIKTLPGIYIGTDDVMIDSGSVLGFFDLRRRTDVDLLFLNDIDKSILGNHNGIPIQAHAFKFNSIPKERAWGEYHFSTTGPQNQYDLFYDPQNYGYCYGLKFVSLKQLVRYKKHRNEPNKDSYDVDLINILLDTLSIPNKCPNLHGKLVHSVIVYLTYLLYAR
ncbi:uncharacterized protein LOC123524935 [Mercenaria mercenaria]|uniref:uncharacterized protein LOC123524935 n=1 Tax=Mercenaria mercenaria TaxID=6596 RepID=UPI00234E4AB6|nr:uncharacterized protein LOC123524935 [Mercenaria mercenaria]